MKKHLVRIFSIVLIGAFCTQYPSPTRTFALTLLGTTERVSVSSCSEQGNNSSSYPSTSANGRYVAYQSAASNLVSNDTNDAEDVFVHDRQSGATQRVSISSSGGQANNDSWHPSISGDGRYVAYDSLGSNLVAEDTNNYYDIFVYDRQFGRTERVSISTSGEQGNGNSYSPSISYTGRFVSFESDASNLVTGDTNVPPRDVFVHDRQTRITERVSISNKIGDQGNDGSLHPAISADGRFVAFESGATNLVTGDTSYLTDIFVRDRQNNTTERVSISSDGDQSNRYSGYPTISADGRFVAFQSDASNLTNGDTNGVYDIYIHDRQTSLTELVSVSDIGALGNNASQFPAISMDGRYITFVSTASNLSSDDQNMVSDIFIHDRHSGSTELVSVSSNGEQGSAVDGSRSSISADGRIIGFYSRASNLVIDDTNGYSDVFVHDRSPVGPDRPKLDLPIDYQGRSTCSATGFRAAFTNRVNSKFDHFYPTYLHGWDCIGNPSSGIQHDNRLTDWTGEPKGPPGNVCDTVLGFSSYDGHDGYDFSHRCPSASPCSAPLAVYSAASGTIISANWHDNVLGCQIRIDHGNNWITTYSHLQDSSGDHTCDGILIHSGTVTSSDQIAIMGHSGSGGGGANNVHLHFNLYHNNIVVDPSGWDLNPQTNPDPWAQQSGEMSYPMWKYSIGSSQALATAEGGQLSTPSNEVTVTIPAHYYSSQLMFNLNNLPSGQAFGNMFNTGRSFSLTASDEQGNLIHQLDLYLTVEVKFSIEDVQGILADTLSLFTWDNNLSTWVPISTSIDWENLVATIQVNHLSSFALMGEAQNHVYIPLTLN